jgi:hypothetical protein
MVSGGQRGWGAGAPSPPAAVPGATDAARRELTRANAAPLARRSRHRPAAHPMGQPPPGSGRRAGQDASVQRAGRQGQRRRAARGARVAPAEDGAPLQRPGVDRRPWRYAGSRPWRWCAERPPQQRAEAPPPPMATVRARRRRCPRPGLRGLVPDEVAIVPQGTPPRGPQTGVDARACLQRIFPLTPKR